MPLTLHLGARTSAADDVVLRAVRARGGLLVARDEALLAQHLRALVAGGAVLDVRGATQAGLLAIVRERAGLGEAPRRSGVALRSAIVSVLGEDVAGRLAPLERAVRELRGARVPASAVMRLAAVRPSPALRELDAVVRACAEVELPEDDLWRLVDAARAVELGVVAVVSFDDFAPWQWALLRALAETSDVQVSLPFEDGRAAYAARVERVAPWRADAAAVVVHEAVLSLIHI